MPTQYLGENSTGQLVDSIKAWGISTFMKLEDKPSYMPIDASYIHALTGVPGMEPDSEDAWIYELAVRTITDIPSSVASDVAVIPPYMFAYCSCLKKAMNFQECTTIQDHAFMGCTTLEGAVFPNCVKVENYAFYGCTTLKAIALPKCTTLASNAFSECTLLENVYLDSLVSLSSSCFYSKRMLRTVYLPNCETISTNAFAGAEGLKEIELPNCKTIGVNAFNGCARLESVYLMGSSYVSIYNSQVFGSRTRLTVYVPSSMYSTYITMSNWSAIASYLSSVSV